MRLKTDMQIKEGGSREETGRGDGPPCKGAVLEDTSQTLRMIRAARCHTYHTHASHESDTPGPCTGCGWGCTDRQQPLYGWKVLENQRQSEFLKTEGSGMVAMQAYDLSMEEWGG